MHEFVAEAIAFAASHRPGVRFSDHESDLESLAAQLPTNATSALSSFLLGDDDDTSGDLVPANLELPIELANEANSCWNDIRGPYEPERALAVVAAARIEFTRCVFFDLLSRFRRACLNKDEASAALTRNCITPIDWLNADHVAALSNAVIFNRQPMHIAGDTSGHVFRLWLQEGKPERWKSGNNPSFREPEDFELLDAIALVWLDAAASVSLANVELLARAAGARFHAAIASAAIRNSASATNPEVISRQSSTFSHMGHNARHARNREMKAAAISEFKKGNYRSKEIAAEQIAAKLGFAYSTVRNWLINS